MTEWFTESSLIPLVVGTFIALGFFGLAFSFRDRTMLLLGLIIAIITAGITITEKLIVTDQEAIKAIVMELAVAVNNNNVAGVIKHVSPAEAETIARIESEMPRVQVRSCRVTGWREFSSLPGTQPPTATIDFIVLASGTMRDGGGTTQVRVILDFEKGTDGKWRVVDYEPSNPRDGVSL